MQMQVITMQMLPYKDMINGETYNVFMHHVMIFQKMDVYREVPIAWVGILEKTLPLE